MLKYAKVIDQEKHIAQVGTGTDKDFYESIGMALLDVEQGYDGGWYLAGHAPKKPQAQVEAEALAQAKAERSDAVSKIIVTVDGMSFDGDEESQTRMGRTIAAAVAIGVDLATEKRTWVLADNSIAQVSIKQLAEALRLAGDAQTALWTVPYANDK